MEEEKPETVRTYNSVWRIEKILYGIQDFALPVALSYRQIGFFLLGLGLVWLLNQVPPLSLLQMGLIEYLFLPGLFAWYFTDQKLDGKKPHKAILTRIRFYFSPHRFNRYQEVSDGKKPYKYKGNIAYRVLSIHERGDRHGR